MLLVIIPMSLLGLYVYRRKTTKSYIVAGFLLIAFIFCLSLVLLEGHTDLTLNNVVGTIGTFGFGFIIFVLAITKPSPSNKKAKKEELSSYEQSTAFRFKAGNKDLIIRNPFRGIFVVGGAGSGKSKTFIYPIIKQSAQQEYTGVLYDFKSPELINLARTCYRGSREALIFNLMPEYITKQDFWSRSILSLFSGTIWYFKKNHPQYATLPHVFAFMFTASAKQLIKILSSDREIKGYISSLSEAVEQGADKQVAGVLGTLKNAIGLYNTPDIFWLLSKNEVNLNVNDPYNPTMLLIGNDSKLSDTYAPLCSLIITVSTKLMNEPEKAKSVIIIDESPTIYLPNFEQIPATSRSNKIAVVVGAQDISQMRDKYGVEKAEVLISNLGNQFFGRTTNKETAERVYKPINTKKRPYKNTANDDFKRRTICRVNGGRKKQRIFGTSSITKHSTNRGFP